MTIIWGKSRENMIRFLSKRLRGRPGKFLWHGHDAFYWRTRWIEIRIMKRA